MIYHHIGSVFAVSACTPVSNHLAHRRADDDRDDHIHDGHPHADDDNDDHLHDLDEEPAHQLATILLIIMVMMILMIIFMMIIFMLIIFMLMMIDCCDRHDISSHGECIYSFTHAHQVVIKMGCRRKEIALTMMNIYTDQDGNDQPGGR